jgi:hypothetical protein
LKIQQQFWIFLGHNCGQLLLVNDHVNSPPS